jgi:hypothetical protein
MLMERGSGAMTRTLRSIHKTLSSQALLSGTSKPAKPVKIVLRLDLSLDLT